MSGCEAARWEAFDGAGRKLFTYWHAYTGACWGGGGGIIFKNDSRPEELPPPDRGSPAPLMLEKLEPVPDPNLNSSASRFHSPIIELVPPTNESLTDWIKQA